MQVSTFLQSRNQRSYGLRKRKLTDADGISIVFRSGDSPASRRRVFLRADLAYPLHNTL
jgi:hypothetical protein